jgi:hypothetical protein
MKMSSCLAYIVDQKSLKNKARWEEDDILFCSLSVLFDFSLYSLLSAGSLSNVFVQLQGNDPPNVLITEEGSGKKFTQK